MNEQESMWAGDFGDGYTRRMNGNVWIESNIAFWHKIFAKGYKTALPNRKYCNCKYYDGIYYSLDRCNV